MRTDFNGRSHGDTSIHCPLRTLDSKYITGACSSLCRYFVAISDDESHYYSGTKTALNIRLVLPRGGFSRPGFASYSLYSSAIFFPEVYSHCSYIGSHLKRVLLRNLEFWWEGHVCSAFWLYSKSRSCVRTGDVFVQCLRALVPCTSSSRKLFVENSNKL